MKRIKNTGDKRQPPCPVAHREAQARDVPRVMRGTVPPPTKGNTMSVRLRIALLALVGCAGAPPAGETQRMRPLERPMGFVLDSQAWDCRTAGPCDQCRNISHRVADVTLAIERRDGSIAILTRAHQPGAVVELCLPAPGRYATTEHRPWGAWPNLPTRDIADRPF
jgi:hypothetical protein